MNESHVMILKDFIEENWMAFEMRAEEQGEDPEEILESLEKASMSK